MILLLCISLVSLVLLNLVDSRIEEFKTKKSIDSAAGAIGFKSIHLNVLLERALNSSDYAQCELLLRLGAEVEQPESFY
jgi:hypothetical protein